MSEKGMMSAKLIGSLMTFGVLFFATDSASAQDLFMRRQNTLGNWRARINNNGVLFNESDSDRIPPLGGGGWWYTPDGSLDTLVFGGGLWVGGLRRSSVFDSLEPHVEYSYSPNTGISLFVPGSIIYDGQRLDTNQASRDKYRVYRSTDVTGPAWPIRLINGKPEYVDDVTQREAAGPKSTIGEEDVFVIYKDSDPIYPIDTPPLGIEVRSELAFWSSGLLKDVVLVHNEIISTSGDTVFNPVIGLALDGDIQNPDDDRTKGVQTEGAASAVFFSDQSTTDPMLGVTLLAGQHGTDRPNAGLTSLRYWDIADDPETDSARYQYLIVSHHDTALSRVGDARVLMASLSPKPLLPGDTVYFDYALFAIPSSGMPSLSKQDSTKMLQITQLLVNHFYSGSLWQLEVQRDPKRGTQGNSTVQLYPNPVSEELHFRMQKSDWVGIYDVLGRERLKSRISAGEASITVSGLPDGQYFLKVGGEENVSAFDIIR